jgi:hypothetical protein
MNMLPSHINSVNPISVYAKENEVAFVTVVADGFFYLVYWMGITLVRLKEGK